jgi:hypothetical protein
VILSAEVVLTSASAGRGLCIRETGFADEAVAVPAIHQLAGLVLSHYAVEEKVEVIA